MKVPSMPFTLMVQSYRKVFPLVEIELSYWKKRAEAIPDPELRKQALVSIEHKTFHCEGGAIMALLANKHYEKVIPFIVAYQTISDYLDNLCDRSTSLDPADFTALHEAMKDALSTGEIKGDYYRFRQEYNDGDYLHDLVMTCRDVLKKCNHYDFIKKDLLQLCHYYCDLQVHKHVISHERVSRLKQWHRQNREAFPEMEWYEFSACTGSTLGIFCLVSYAFNFQFQAEDVEKIRNGYFPYVQGLHILLDYFIDQEEDTVCGDLNFCSFYKDSQQLFNRLEYFFKESDAHVKHLPYKRFHQLINRGLLGLYLSDEKVRKQQNVRNMTSSILKTGGPVSYFFFINALIYRKLKDTKS